MRHLAALLVLPWICIGALAEESSLPRLLSDAQRLNEARAHRIDAEIALQQTIVKGRQALLDEGYAAPLEVDLAHTRLREMEALRSSVHKYQTYLDQLSAACRNHPRPLGAKQQVMIRLPDTLAPTALLFDVASAGESYQELKSLSERIATARAGAQGQLEAVAAEVTFLEELIKRLHDIHDGSVSLNRERELASLRLAVAESRLAMGRARQQYESCHELLHHDGNRKGFPIQVGDQAVDSPAQLWQLIELQWQIHRTEAERAAVIARSELQSIYRDKLSALANAGLGRPGEARLLTAVTSESLRKLGDFDHRLSQLRRFQLDLSWISEADRGDCLRRLSSGDSLRGFSDHAAAPRSHRDSSDIGAEITAARWRIAQLTRISPQDEATTNELAQTNLELAVHQAELQSVQEAEKLAVLASQLRSHEMESTTVRVSTTRGAAAAATHATVNDEHDPMIVAIFAAKANSQGKLALAKSRQRLLKSKLDHLRGLRRLGYATWKEVALAERDLAISQADECAAAEEQRIARFEYQRIKLAIDTKQDSDPHIAALAR